jgi:hypothetical protein
MAEWPSFNPNAACIRIGAGKRPILRLTPDEAFRRARSSVSSDCKRSVAFEVAEGMCLTG